MTQWGFPMETQVMRNVSSPTASGWSMTRPSWGSPSMGISARVRLGCPMLTRTRSTAPSAPVKSCRVRTPAPVSAVIVGFRAMPWS